MIAMRPLTQMRVVELRCFVANVGQLNFLPVCRVLLSSFRIYELNLEFFRTSVSFVRSYIPSCGSFGAVRIFSLAPAVLVTLFEFSACSVSYK